ncbi:hypothetical protein MPLA_1820003 [Mesorhizobium sp. ORS 3359]|nr:hypothetical protein MPLA_1820003 [Mesorhizobium sp. ORS 3359]
MPEFSLYGKLPGDFQPRRLRIGCRGDGTGSRARTYDLRFWRPPLYQLSYARACACSAQALPKSFRALCKEH